MGVAELGRDLRERDRWIQEAMGKPFQELSIAATCPAGTVPFIGGSRGTRLIPPNPGTLVFVNAGTGPSFDQWSANWASLRSEGTLFDATRSVAVFFPTSG